VSVEASATAQRVGEPAGAIRDATALRTDPAAWDAFVAATRHGSYLQLAAWAGVKAANGWRGRRVVADGPGGPIGAQVLLRRPRGSPWSFGYAPRGPVTDDWSEASIGRLGAALRASLRRGPDRASHVRIDPEVERDGPDDPGGSLVAALAARGWRPGPPIQPGRTRVIDLRADEAALWSDLRKKWRQYVNKARANAVRVVDADGDRLDDFYRIYVETAERAGFTIRTAASYRLVWDAFRPAGQARLLFAEGPDGEPLATLFLVRCGDRVVEPYGGMTGLGADLRANYLLKWEAIRSSREAGAAVYDLWGLAHPGIAHFKTGFGGREVVYVGAYDLAIDPLGRRLFVVGERVRSAVARRKARSGGRSASEAPGTVDPDADAG